MPILKVAVSVPLSREFDYLSATTEPEAVPGCRVLVPFGRRRQVGLVLGRATESGLARDQIRQSLETLDDSPLLTEDDLWLIRFTSDYYHHPIGEVVATALPTLLRQGKPLNPTIHCVAVSDAGESADIESLAKRAPRQAELLEILLDAGGNGVDEETLTEWVPTWRRAAKALFEKGLAHRFSTRADGDEPVSPGSGEAGPALHAAQQQALERIEAHEGFGVFLLDGVTGSGKTEVYLRMIRQVVDAGRQVLILVPEIGLTPQLVSRLETRLGVAPAVMHSGLSDTARLVAWRRARAASAKLVVGTRSAVFTPMPDLGLIVIDEEHDHSFKQQEGLRYSARDLAIARAKRKNIPVILGSATPTLEVLQHCRAGNFVRLQLPDRAGNAKPPNFRLIDLMRAPARDGLSEPMLRAIDKHLDSDGQALIFLNRRGFAPTLICASCGHVAECYRCDSRMTVHAKNNVLRCHHCGAARALDVRCTVCGAEVRPLGEGTERLEDALRAHFPGRRIERIDSDSMQRRGAIDEALELAAQGGADILVGTQMLSKGHHFPKLTLVGIVNADQGLFGTDFRSAERMAQSIIQVAGRAGRESRQGEVIIQTAFPDNPFWKCLIEGGYPRIADDALAEREESRWPPFTRLALIRSAAHKKSDAHALLDVARRRIEAKQTERLRILGPVDAPMARRAGRYRAQLLLQSSDRRLLHEILADLRPALESEPSARKVRWSIDVDPVELF
ncbi:MAG: primosomal protein N' [Woeseiaceae bacterium]|nr:primosomal protein N' [Woeseiaceae bacterium]NIP20561.1 primosomal protein N' [Woeseiaceae bacterium]NIS89354.1 primosomal protein N' [Woeseiaceae bacterium]